MDIGLNSRPTSRPAVISPSDPQNRSGSRSFSHVRARSADAGSVRANSKVWLITVSLSRARKKAIGARKHPKKASLTNWIRCTPDKVPIWLQVRRG